MQDMGESFTRQLLCGVARVVSSEEQHDLGLVENGGELGGTLGTDLVAPETVNDGWSRDGQGAGLSAGADTKANAWGRFKPPSSILERLQRQVAL